MRGRQKRLGSFKVQQVDGIPRVTRRSPKKPLQRLPSILCNYASLIHPARGIRTPYSPRKRGGADFENKVDCSRWTIPDLNRSPRPCHGRALPDELMARVWHCNKKPLGRHLVLQLNLGWGRPGSARFDFNRFRRNGVLRCLSDYFSVRLCNNWLHLCSQLNLTRNTF